MAVKGSCVLVSSDMQRFAVERSKVTMSNLVKEMIDEEVGSDSVPEIPLPNVKGTVLQKVIDFCSHYEKEPMPEIEKPLKSTNMNEVVSEWYAKFMDLDHELLFELILAANYMDIKSLLDLTCAKVGSMIKGKSVEEIREVFSKSSANSSQGSS